MSVAKRARKAPERYGEPQSEEFVALVLKHVAVSTHKLPDSRWQLAVRILKEEKEVGCAPRYLVEFAGSDEPEWADQVSARLLARWRVKQQSGVEKELIEYLGIHPTVLGADVPAEDRTRLLGMVAQNILKVLNTTLSLCKSRRSKLRPTYAFTIPCKPKEFCALFPEECAAAIETNEFKSVLSTHGFALALSFAEARELLDDVVPGWWFLASDNTPTARLVDKDKRITFSLRVRSFTDHSHNNCPRCSVQREWTSDEARKHLIPDCVTVPKIKLSGLAELQVRFSVQTDRVSRSGGPLKPAPSA
eukprot:m.43260 g.43260  ORF g.43260 m.43260 type:complete len:305 (+) comp10753_c0_seq3:91-1005(+)